MWCFGERRERPSVTHHLSLESNPGHVVPLGHVGDDHAVPDREPLEHFYRIHGSPSEFHVDAIGFLSIFGNPEEPDRALGRSVGRAADGHHVRETLDLDRAVHADVGTGALGQLAVDRHFHHDRTLLRAWVEAHDVPFYDTVARVDRCLLPDGAILGLRLGDAQHGLESTRLRHTRELHPGVHPLAQLELRPRAEVEQHAVLTGHDVHRAHAILLLAGDVREAHHLLLRETQLLLRRLVHLLELRLLDLHALCQLGHPVARRRNLALRGEAFLVERLGHLDLPVGVLELRAQLRDRGFLRQANLLELAPEARELTAGGGDRLVCSERLELHVGVAELNDERCWVDDDTRPDRKRFDATGGDSGDDPDVLRHERAGRADLTQQLALTDRIHPQRRALNVRSGGLEPADDDRNDHDGKHARTPGDVLLLLGRGSAFDVHESVG